VSNRCIGILPYKRRTIRDDAFNANIKYTKKEQLFSGKGRPGGDIFQKKKKFSKKREKKRFFFVLSLPRIVFMLILLSVSGCGIVELLCVAALHPGQPPGFHHLLFPGGVFFSENLRQKYRGRRPNPDALYV
jgi:hypothetical protein